MRSIKATLCFIAVIFLSPFLEGVAGDSVRELSVNGNRYSAYVLPVNGEDRIVVRRRGANRDIAELSLLSRDNQQGGHIEDIQWSEGGRFLVFSTSSSGGHSPWNFKTYIFSTERWSFLDLDEAIAPVTSPIFRFTGSTHLEIEVLKSPESEIDDSVKRVIDLETLPWKAQKTTDSSAEHPPAGDPDAESGWPSDHG